MFIEHCNKNNINVLFTVCVANLYEVKIVKDKFQSEIRILSACKLNPNFKILKPKFKNSNFV